MGWALKRFRKNGKGGIIGNTPQLRWTREKEAPAHTKSIRSASWEGAPIGGTDDHGQGRTQNCGGQGKKYAVPKCTRELWGFEVGGRGGRKNTPEKISGGESPCGKRKEKGLIDDKISMPPQRKEIKPRTLLGNDHRNEGGRHKNWNIRYHGLGGGGKTFGGVRPNWLNRKKREWSSYALGSEWRKARGESRSQKMAKRRAANGFVK